WLFRQWLGRWGAILASIMLLVSPLMMYYNRYIRHDTPSILFAVIMMWAILMYVNGNDNQRRRPWWLYIISAMMVLNLGSKETAFIYIAIFGIFLALFWMVRVAQYIWKIPGKVVFNMTMMGVLLGGVLSLGMYIIFDVVRFDLFPENAEVSFGALAAGDQQTFIVWSMLAVAVTLFAVISTLFWAYRSKIEKVKFSDLLIVIGFMVLTCGIFVVFEELSHTQASEAQTAAPPVPGEEGETLALPSSISWLPMVVTWLFAGAVLVFLFIVRRRRGETVDYEGKDKAGRGFWGTMDLFPEFDLLIIIGTLILPWATALIPYVMRGSSTDYIAIAQGLPPVIYNIVSGAPGISTPEQIGQIWLSALAWLPLFAVSTIVGLVWDWRRWLVSAGIFYVIFAFFFTTVFTNIAGLGTGMVYSLGYWLEQQGVRRGSQPQYYYLLVIMPFYEFLPVIGGTLAMFAGLVKFWRWRKDYDDLLPEKASVVKASVVDESMIEAGQELMAENAEVSGYSEDESALLVSDDAVIETDILADESVDEKFSPAEIARREMGQLREIPFLIMVSWLGILNLVGYSLAGEKMPWLGTHLTLPLIFLSAWYFGGIIEKIDVKKFMKMGWVLMFVLPLLYITVAQVIIPLMVGRGPFQGLSQQQLQETYSWLAVVGMSGVLIYVVAYITTRLDMAHLRQMMAVTLFIVLGVMSFRSAWIASFINYDYATEFLVYAHAAPAVKTVLDDIEELSFRITDGKELKFAYDNSVSWPYSWYFRDYTNATFVGENPTVQNLEDAVVVVVGDDKRSKVEPILEDRYQRFDHMRLWWPMQEYFGLTPARIQNAFDFSPDNLQAAGIREGMFDIWWSRDYSTYGEAVEKDFSSERWPVSDTMHVYIRKDFARQIWEYGVGDGEIFADESETVNLCRTNWQENREAIGVITSDIQPLNQPMGIDIAEDGTIFVADENAHHISIFDPDGNFMGTIGRFGSDLEQDGAFFFRPNSVSVTNDGNLIVADTWNFRIMELSAQGEVLTTWGERGEYGFAAVEDPQEGLWGPRDVKTDTLGNIFVSDTGNKRIRVYQIQDDNSVVHQYDIGTGGSGEGQLDEPSGVAIHSEDGRVFVADTWNRRVSVFNREGGFMDAYPVRAWYEDKGNRPYLALDESRDLLYVGDMDGGRVMVYSLQTGDCVGAFGQLAGDSNATLAQFGTIAGIAVDDEG
ncbi:MAG: glycosyltransferase family 39 protein, partial [Aggregatilineales bacterium]